MKNIKIYDVRAVKGDSAFLIDDGTTSILYDTGFAFTGYAVADNVKRVLGERPLDFIFLTHSHYDHALGSAYVKKRYPCAKIVAGEYAAKIFAKPTARAVMRELDQKCAFSHGVTQYEDLIDALEVDLSVKDGDEIRAGDMTFSVVSLPGHTKCSVGFYLRENKLLLGTETLGVWAGDGVVVPSYLVGYGIAMESIERAMDMEIDRILVPHFGILEGEDAKRYLQNGKRSARETAEEILAILRDGGSDEDAFAYFKNKFYHGYVTEIYPLDAMTLNTNIMIGLIKKELM